MTSSFATYPSLTNRHVLISGGASAIGACLVAEFLAQGSRVSFLDIDVVAGVQLRDRLAGARHAPMFIGCDVTDIPALQTSFGRAVARQGPVDVLVNNGANDRRQAVNDTTVADWDAAMAVNLQHFFSAAQGLLSSMRQRARGSIVNLGSISWMPKTPGMPVYTAAKAAMHGLTRSLARELGRDGVRVNTVVPGWVMTEQLATGVAPDTERLIDASQCLPGRLQPGDVARVVLFLAADDSRMCTAQDFIVDGGWT